MRHARNFAVVALLALGVTALPGGGTAADVFGAFLFVVLTIGIGLVGGKMYLENRYTIASLPDSDRGLLYGALGVMVVTVAAGDKLFGSGPGTLLWLILVAGSIAALVAVWQRSRQY